MVMKILKGLGAAISPGVRRGGTRRGSGSRYYRRNKKDGTVSAVSEQTLAKRGAAAAGAGAAGAGATGAALASDDSESTRRRVNRRGRPLKSQTNGKNEAATEKSNNKRQTRRGMRAAPATTTPATKAKNYNVGVSRGGVPFAESFKYHRDKGQKTFTWNGKKYTTDVKGGGKTGAGKTGTGKTGTGKTGTGKTSTKETSASKKSAGQKGLDRFRSRRKAGGGMMKKKGFSQGGLSESEKEPKVKKKVPSKKRPIAKSLKARQAKEKQKEERRKRADAAIEKARLAETTISKDRVGSSRGGRVPKEGMEERFLQGLKSRNKKRSMNRGGMMAKKGYARGGLASPSASAGGRRRSRPGGRGAQSGPRLQPGPSPMSRAAQQAAGMPGGRGLGGNRLQAGPGAGRGSIRRMQAQQAGMPGGRSRGGPQTMGGPGAMPQQQLTARLMSKGGMTKKGYAKGGSVRGKPRGVGAALRGHGKALK